MKRKGPTAQQGHHPYRLVLVVDFNSINVRIDEALILSDDSSIVQFRFRLLRDIFFLHMLCFCFYEFDFVSWT